MRHSEDHPAHATAILSRVLQSLKCVVGTAILTGALAPVGAVARPVAAARSRAGGVVAPSCGGSSAAVAP